MMYQLKINGLMPLRFIFHLFQNIKMLTFNQIWVKFANLNPSELHNDIAAFTRDSVLTSRIQITQGMP